MRVSFPEDGYFLFFLLTLYILQKHLIIFFFFFEGIEFLREFLHLPPSIFPATLSKKTINRAPKIDDEFSRELRQPMGRGRMYDKRNFD